MPANISEKTMKVTVRRKVLGLIAVSVLLCAAIVTAVSAYDIVKRGQARATDYKATLLAERKAQIKGYVDMAAKLIENLPLDQARKLILTLRYGDKGYVFLQDYNNFFLAHPDPALDQKDQTNLKDPNGVYMIRELTRIAREDGEGYLNYEWKIPGQQNLRPKISYGKSIPDKKWVVATGLYIDDIDEAVSKEQTRIKHDVFVTITTQLSVAMVTMIALMMGAAWFVSRSITGPLEKISRAMKEFDNDLTTTIEVQTNDEVGDLAAWLNEHIAGLHRSMRLVAEVTEQLHGHAKTIAGSTNQQSSFAAELSSSVAEMTSTMEELSASASQIAQHSQGVVERADRTLQDTRRGSTEVGELTARIDDINNDMQANLNEIVDLGRKSKEITRIMEIINDIANQTRLIAFNAALEAASAGESGKRFGVVAVEIRRLADSVVESTGEIEGRITEILDSVNRLVMSSEKTSVMMREGQESSTRTVTMLGDIVEGVEEATDSARQISLSTQQQQIASSQVLLAIREIDGGVRQSTESARESNLVAEELAVLSGKLKDLVTTFRIDGSRDGLGEASPEREEPAEVEA